MVQTLSLTWSAAWRAATSARCWAGVRKGGPGQCRLSGILTGGPSPVPKTHPGTLMQPLRPLRAPVSSHQTWLDATTSLSLCLAQGTRPGFPTHPSGVALSIQGQAPPCLGARCQLSCPSVSPGTRHTPGAAPKPTPALGPGPFVLSPRMQNTVTWLHPSAAHPSQIIPGTLTSSRGAVQMWQLS